MSSRLSIFRPVANPIFDIQMKTYCVNDKLHKSISNLYMYYVYHVGTYNADVRKENSNPSRLDKNGGQNR